MLTLNGRRLDHVLGPVAAHLPGLTGRAGRAQWPERRQQYDAIERRITGWGLGACLRRPGGELYTDRAVLHEEALGDVSGLAFDPTRLGDRLAGLTTILRVHAGYASAIRADTMAWLTSIWDAHGLGEHAPLGALLRAAADWTERFNPVEGTPAAESLWQRVAALCPPQATRVELTAGEVGATVPGSDEPFVCSPDLLLAAPGGAAGSLADATVVLGDLHHGAQVWSFAMRLADQRTRDAIQATLARWSSSLTGGGGQLATLLDPRMTGKAFTLEWPGLTIERMARSAKPPELVRSLWSVTVTRTGNELTLLDGGTPLLLAPTSPVDPVVRAFGALVLWGPRLPSKAAHTPRVTVDGVVWFRESWRLLTRDCGDWRGSRPLDLLAATRRLRRRYDLPRRVFIRAPGEAKPYFCDLASLSSALLLRSLMMAHSELTVTEMLPDASDLWLRLPSGSYTSELRLSLLVT